MSSKPEMKQLAQGRPGFMEWVNEHPQPNWQMLPLTHITRGVLAEDIMRKGTVEPSECKHFGEPLAYFFYGRPAYRIAGQGVVKSETLCPFCLIFRPELIESARAIHAFDSGAHQTRMYSHVVADEMEINDFRLEPASATNRLISAVFGSQRAYFDGDTRAVAAKAPHVEPYQFHARAYLDLILSPGRNEPDDRVCTIEVAMDSPVALAGSLLAIALPHTLSSAGRKAPWLEELYKTSVSIIPYQFVPGRSPEHYHTLLEQAVRHYYEQKGLL